MNTLSNIINKDNLILAFNRLLTNPESTYKSFFRNTYSAYALTYEKNIEMLTRKMKPGYLPESSMRVYMPKSNGLCRMYTLLSIEDQIVYQAYANIIAKALITKPKIKNRFRKINFGNLYAGNDSLFLYQRWQDCYKAYTKAIINAYNKGCEFIASFDLTACYDSINHHLLWKQLKENYGFDENSANSFIQLLEKWESSNEMELGTGIPQGPQASGIVSEIILAEYDSYIESLQKLYDFCYYRYVDDIRILSSNESTVQYVLYLLDIKSKSLGLFPQASKISVHKIESIEDEIKRISLPLFEDEFDEKTQSDIAISRIRKILKEEPIDLTSIKRYFQFVQHSSKANKLAITLIRQAPNIIHSFAYYVKRYPRKLPHSITDYIYECCNDKALQFSSGLLLEAAIGNIDSYDSKRFVIMAEGMLELNKKNHFIVDSRYLAQLNILILHYNQNVKKNYIKGLSLCNWWVRASVICFSTENKDHGKLPLSFLQSQMKSSECEPALAAAMCYLKYPGFVTLPKAQDMSPCLQNILKQSGIIQRGKYIYSQINRYLYEITGNQYKLIWKKKLGKHHELIERTLFTALGYWKTDLTAFVNLWDTIDDRLCDLLAQSHSELGGYTLGSIGGIFNSQGFKTHLPNFLKMCNAIHELRLTSHLSHSEVRRTHKYTGPILQKERKRVKRLICDGLNEITTFW